MKDEKKIGRPLIGDEPLSGAARQRRYREELAAKGLKEYTIVINQDKVEKLAKKLSCTNREAAQEIVNQGMKTYSKIGKK